MGAWLSRGSIWLTVLQWAAPLTLAVLTEKELWRRQLTNLLVPNTATSAPWESTLESLGRRRAAVGCYYLCKSGTTSVEGTGHVAWVTSVGTQEALSHHLSGGQRESLSSLTACAQPSSWHGRYSALGFNRSVPNQGHVFCLRTRGSSDNSVPLNPPSQEGSACLVMWDRADFLMPIEVTFVLHYFILNHGLV